MIYEVLDNSIDEALAGYCTKVLVILNADGTVKDHRCQWDYMDGTCKSWINSPNTLQICDRVEGNICKNTDYLLPSEKTTNGRVLNP